METTNGMPFARFVNELAKFGIDRDAIYEVCRELHYDPDTDYPIGPVVVRRHLATYFIIASE